MDLFDSAIVNINLNQVEVLHAHYLSCKNSGKNWVVLEVQANDKVLRTKGEEYLKAYAVHST